MADTVKDFGFGITLSVIGHAVLLLILSFNLVFAPKKLNQPVQLAIEANIVEDTATTRQRAEELERRREAEEQRIELEQQRKAEEEQRIELDKQQKAEQEQRKNEEIRLAAEREKAEAAAKLKAEAEAEAAAARKAEEQRKQEDETRRKAEEQRKKEEAARKERERVAAEQRLQQEREAQMDAMLAEEEQRAAAVDSGLLDQWITVIQQRVERNWIKPPGSMEGLECEVRVTQIPGGEVVRVEIPSNRCNGDAAVIRSLERAVERASPLPPPDDPSLFERNLIFVFKPKQ